MEHSEENTISEQKPFSPSITKTFSVQGVYGFLEQAIAYNAKHNMIIACPKNNTVQFFDAKTFLPMENRKVEEKLDGSVTKIAFCEESETYLLLTSHGMLYAYDVANNTMKVAKKGGNMNGQKLDVAWINSESYALMKSSRQIFIGNLKDEAQEIKINETENSFTCVKSLPKKNLLFVGLFDGSVRMYRTDQLPELTLLSTTKDSKENTVLEIECVTMNGKEYVLTVEINKQIRLWQLTEREMELVRIIPLKEIARRVVCLKDYKKLAVHLDKTKEVVFVDLLSGKSESKIDVGLDQYLNIFSMKNKNAIGVAGSKENKIKIIKLNNK